ARWSPDGKWIAYPAAQNGELQLWCSSADGKIREQVTHNDADVREFEWRHDGQAIFFSVGISRAAKKERDEIRARTGYNYEDLITFADFMLPELRHAPD